MKNPLLNVAKDHSRHLVAFVVHPKLLAPLRPIAQGNLDTRCARQSVPAPLTCGVRQAYWIASLNLDFARKAGAGATTRNWATVLKLLAAAQAMS